MGHVWKVPRTSFSPLGAELPVIDVSSIVTVPKMAMPPATPFPGWPVAPAVPWVLPAPPDPGDGVVGLCLAGAFFGALPGLESQCSGGRVEDAATLGDASVASIGSIARGRETESAAASDGVCSTSTASSAGPTAATTTCAAVAAIRLVGSKVHSNAGESCAAGAEQAAALPSARSAAEPAVATGAERAPATRAVETAVATGAALAAAGGTASAAIAPARLIVREGRRG